MAIPFHDRRTGEILYHGTNVELHPGDVIKPTIELGSNRHGDLPFGPQRPAAYFAHATPGEHAGAANMYATSAANKRGGNPRVYEVTPLNESDVETWHRTRVSPSGFRVVKEISHDPTEATWRHSNGRVKYNPENYGK